jgi:hypothetical protein
MKRKNNSILYILQQGFLCLIFLSVFSSLSSAATNGGFISGDVEKPKPVFTREGDVIAAKLVPRAKNSSVMIRFKASGGRLVAVSGIDFFQAARPEVNVKDYRSALFGITIDGVTPGGEALVSIFSDFFNSATRFWVFNEKSAEPWMDSNAKSAKLSGKVQEIAVRVKDGGPFDADGAADGKITLIGGQKDSFWGYALGTLVIRFFGVFLVLCVLMIGMMLSGLFLSRLKDKRSEEEGAALQFTDTSPVEQEDGEGDLSPETVAAIALALNMHLSSTRRASSPMAESPSDSWTQSGRSTLMADRLTVFNR